MTTIKLNPDYFPLVQNGSKVQTIREGRRDYPLGPAKIESDGKSQEIEIQRLEYARLADVTEAEARRDGFGSKDELVNALHRFYPDLEGEDVVTLVHFECT